MLPAAAELEDKRKTEDKTSPVPLWPVSIKQHLCRRFLIRHFCQKKNNAAEVSRTDFSTSYGSAVMLVSGNPPTPSPAPCGLLLMLLQKCLRALFPALVSSRVLISLLAISSDVPVGLQESNFLFGELADLLKNSAAP